MMDTLSSYITLDVPDLRPTTSSSAGDPDWASLFVMPTTPPSDTLDYLDSFKLEIDMPPTLSTNSSPPLDFAFEPPNKTPLIGGTQNNNNYHFTPNGQTYPPSGYGAYSTGSSFSSSASGSIGGASFSSADALPAISRDFSRPSPIDRRPATAGGALQSRSPMPMYRKETIEEEFINPFGAPESKPLPSEVIDPRHIPANRRASEGFSMPPPAWPQQQQQQQQHHQQQQQQQHQQQQQAAAQAYMYNQDYRGGRPQTSDGLPSFGGSQTLPSARSALGSVDGFTPISGLAPPATIRSSFSDYRPATAESVRYGAPQRHDPNVHFMPIGGPTPKKRPRRRYDEIERMYLCGWNGCEKSYGTLNHLNAHVAMQKHGEKRLPSEFKDLRKAFRKRKREQAAAAANASNPQYVWNRGSTSSESDYSRRDSTLSSGASLAGGGRYSDASSVYSYDSRPNTASSIASSSMDNNAYPTYSGYPGLNDNASTAAAASAAGLMRRDSAPQHIPLPSHHHALGFRAGDDGPTPTQQNPFPSNSGPGVPPMLHGRNGPMGGGAGAPPHGFPFQALTQPMPMSGASAGAGAGHPQSYSQQFAFQR